MGWKRGNGNKQVSQTSDWWDILWDPKVQIPDQGLVGGRMSHGIPSQHGTMGRPEVPVDILRQSWTTMVYHHEILIFAALKKKH